MKPFWQDKKVVVAVGSGGVGKTTTAAAIGLAAARSGLSTLVMTIDPARRLANAMGLPEFGNVEREIRLELTGRPDFKLQAPLWAMMPDVKRTFDGVVEELAPDPERLQRILHNRFYQELSTSLAGAIEFAAVEKLFEVYMSGRYDLIVLDTPPSQNAIDFLEAPGRLLEFLEQDHWQWLLRPYAAAAGLMSKKLTDYGSSFILRNLGKLAGLDTLRELAEFLFTFHGMYDEFRERSRRVRELLVSEELAFVIVTSTQPNQFPAVLALKDGLHQKDMRVRAVIVNRMRQDPLAQTGQTRAAASQRIGALFDGAAPGLQGQVEQAIDEEQAFAALASQAVTRLQTALGHTPVLPLPELPLDAHDQDSLVALQDALISQLAKA